MRYSGNTCDGCGEFFTEEDNIVVCPECATPQHRHCYDEKGGCVNAHLHAEGFQWKSSAIPPKKQDAQQEMLICPNCKMQNPKGSTVCENCGMKFVVFGVNVVESMQQGEDLTTPEDTQQKIPHYEAPFVLGEGEGFGYESEDPAQTEGEDAPKAEPVYFDENDDENIFKGPYPDTDKTLGVRTNTLGLFIRGNADSYISKFKRSEIGGRLGFNWAALFFGPLWFFYRKMIKPGIVFLTTNILLSIVATPFVTKTTEVFESILSMAESGAMTEEALMEQFIENATDALPMLILFEILMILPNIIAAFIGNKLYKNYVLQKLGEASRLTTRNEKIQFFTKQGGTSVLYCAAAYFAQYLLSMLVSYLMY